MQSSNTDFPSPMLNVDLPGTAVVSDKPLNVNPIFVGLPLESSKKPRPLKDNFGPTLAEHAESNRLARDAKATWPGEGKLSSARLTLNILAFTKFLALIGCLQLITKLDVEAKEDTEIKAKKPLGRASKQKSAQAAIASSVEEKSYLQDEVAAFKASPNNVVLAARVDPINDYHPAKVQSMTIIPQK
ncbi:hypothetical protein M9H77_22175 [Catharanthus roseus]|uniref:Uncharacterized protein n=1 Tax=Catharanthus roseus TaxID=4058 RepID=A0ACC0AS96_CATRO|nr:hypothetical protein M9H77_22175 [Catharanthus roseus]